MLRRRDPSVYAITLLVVVTSIVTLTSCSNQKPAAVASSLTTAEISQEAWRLQELDTEKCMQADGFKYIARPYLGASQIAFASSPFNITMSTARASGFGDVDAVLAQYASTSAGAAANSDPNADIVKTLNAGGQAAYSVELNGSGDGSVLGCRAAAATAAEKKLGPEIIEAESTQVDQVKVIRDPRYTKIMADWIVCMNAEGFHVSSLEALQSKLADDANGAVTLTTSSDGDQVTRIDTVAATNLKSAEVAAAIATVRCLDPHRSEYAQILADARTQ